MRGLASSSLAGGRATPARPASRGCKGGGGDALVLHRYSVRGFTLGRPVKVCAALLRGGRDGVMDDARLRTARRDGTAGPLNDRGGRAHAPAHRGRVGEGWRWGATSRGEKPRSPLPRCEGQMWDFVWLFFSPLEEKRQLRYSDPSVSLPLARN